jgi:CPA2 family monovalent cation:H+ antiporter-2
MKFAPEIARRFAAAPLIANYLKQRPQNRDISVPKTICNHIVVAGYGRVGRVIVRVLRDRGYQVLAIENSEAAIRSLRKENIPYIYGDADAELVLEKAHLDRAKAIAIALPDPSSSRILLQQVLNIAPNIDIVARSHSDREIDLLTKLGATEVVQPEFEAALEMGRQILDTLGEDRSSVSSALQEIRRDRYLQVRDPAKDN